MNCLICNCYIENAKGLAAHLKRAHNISTRQYYDTYIKKPTEGICPVCGKYTKYYNFTRGYNIHCSVKCSSLDPNVQQKLKQTNQSLYNVDVGFQTKQCVKNSHTKEVMQKHKNTMLKHGWRRSKLEETLSEFFENNNITYFNNHITDNYPWKCDFYLPKLNLYIEINGYWTHGNHFFTNSKQDKLQLEKWKNIIQKYKYNNAIEVWTKFDIQKKTWALEHNLNYVVIWNRDQLNQFMSDFNNKTFFGFIDYNYIQ